MVFDPHCSKCHHHTECPHGTECHRYIMVPGLFPQPKNRDEVASRIIPLDAHPPHHPHGKAFHLFHCLAAGLGQPGEEKTREPNARVEENCFLITPHHKTLWDLKQERERQKGFSNLDWLNWDCPTALSARAQRCSTKPRPLPEETAQRKLFSLKHLFNIVP